MRKALAMLIVLVAACSKEKKADVIEKFTGTATVGGKPAKIVGCTAVNGNAVDFKLDNGVTVGMDLMYGMKVNGAKASCTKTEIKSDGSDGPSGPWITGKVSLACNDVQIDVEFDCGTSYRPSNLIR